MGRKACWTAILVILGVLPAVAQRGMRAGNIQAGALCRDCGRGGFLRGGAIAGPGARFGHTILPPGWGRAPATTFGNVNHPGGVIHSFPASPFLRGLVQPGFLGGFGGLIAVPVAVPAGLGLEPQQPNVIVVQLPPPQAPPPSSAAAGVPARRLPVVFHYEAPRPPAQPAASRPLTLLVLKDHSIRAVADYRWEGERLQYGTSYGARDSVPLDLLDLEFTQRLNVERNVRFAIKPDY